MRYPVPGLCGLLILASGVLPAQAPCDVQFKRGPVALRGATSWKPVEPKSKIPSPALAKHTSGHAPLACVSPRPRAIRT